MNKLHVIYILISAVFLFVSNPLLAQDNNYRRVYNDFKKQVRGDYEDFRQKCNAEYAEFMKKAWKEYKTLPAIPRPKDETVPPTVFPKGNEDKPIKDKEITIQNIVEPISPAPQPLPVSPIDENKEDENENFTFQYCGTDCTIRIPKSLNVSIEKCDNGELADAWTVLSENKLNNTIRDFLELRIKLHLCDWAYLNVIDTFAKNCYGQGNKATIVAAYIYCQSGYKMRLGRNGDKLYLLFGTKHGIYDMSYLVIDGITYYPLETNVSKMEICDYTFPKEQSLSLYIPENQLFAYQATPIRTLSSKKYKDMSVNVQVNKNLIDFYNTYPTSEIDNDFMTRWAMYANTPMEQEVREQLYPVLKEKIVGLNELDAANKILNWVQTAFEYEYDDKVWGHDRAFFAEETLFYPYCDCEDRAIFFTRLVRDLLGLKCILVFYPGHLASAVHFNQQSNGDYISLNGDKFVICDPTFIGAPVGLTMIGMDNETANVILLK